MMNSSRYWIGLAALFLSFFQVGGQANDVVCACAPGTYRFVLDFTSVCSEEGPVGGIDGTVCNVEGFGDSAENVTDFVPVTVDFVTVVELGQDFLGVAQQDYSQIFADGDSFDYVSVVSNGNSTYPKAIQLNIFGENADGDAIANIVLVSFTNNCSVYPVFDEGFSLGWAKFTELADPPEGVCTAFDGTNVPTISPSASPTTAPVDVSVPPTMAPVDVSVPPTMAPVDMTPGPTVAPITPAPTPPPTVVPVTPAPTYFPTTFSMSMSMDLDFSMSMSMSMGFGEFDSMLLDWMEEIGDFGRNMPKTKDGTIGKTGKAGKKGKKGKKESEKSGSSKKSGKKDASPDKSSKKDASPDKSSKKDALPKKSSNKQATVPSESSESKKDDKKSGKRRRRLRIHHVVG